MYNIILKYAHCNFYRLFCDKLTSYSFHPKINSFLSLFKMYLKNNILQKHGTLSSNAEINHGCMQTITVKLKLWNYPSRKKGDWRYMHLLSASLICLKIYKKVIYFGTKGALYMLFFISIHSFYSSTLCLCLPSISIVFYQYIVFINILNVCFYSPNSTTIFLS